MTYSLTKYILTLVVVYVIIYVIIFRDKTKEYLNQNWRRIRCYPHIIPIAGISDGVNGNGFIDKTINNFNACSSGFIKSSLDIFMKPLMELLEGLKKGLYSIKNALDVFRRMSKVLREMFATLVENTSKRMANSYSAIIYFQEKLKLLIKKQTAMFEVLSQFASTLPFIMYSFSNGPIPRFGMWLSRYVGVLIAVFVICLACLFGGPFTKMVACPICAVCFPGDTMIELENNEEKEIRKLNIGDQIKNNTITGKIFIKKHAADTYEYKGTIVSGSHLVFENNLWIRVEDSTLSKVKPLNTELYCLITSDNTIFSNNTKFRDYEEIKDKDIKLSINYKFAKYINNNLGYIKTSEDINHSYYWGFSDDTVINLNNEPVKLRNIIDNPEKYDDILGVVEIKDNAIMYDYKGVTVSGNTLVYENKLWVRVFQSIYSTKTTSVNKTYNIITKDSIVRVNSGPNMCIFRDFIESNHDSINDVTDNMVTDRLNLMFNFDK
jgi:hypothetical protein